jgi:hypothetical protein
MDWGTRNLLLADFDKAFWQWYERSGKCAAIASGYVEKTWIILSQILHFLEIILVGIIPVRTVF